MESSITDILEKETRGIEDFKADLLQKMTAAKITKITVEYSGGGDSGGIDSVSLEPNDELSPSTAELKKLAEEFAYAVIEWNHGGWENDEGGQGTVVIDAQARIATLEHTEFFTESSCIETAI